MGKIKTNKENEKIKCNTGITGITVLMIIIGFLLICMSITFKHTDLDVPDFISDICNSIGTTLVSAGFVSVIVEISTIKNVVKAAMSDVLDVNFPLESYSNDKIIKFNNSLVCKRIGQDVNDEFLKNSIYKKEENLIDLVAGKYLEYHKATFVLTPDTDNMCFNKSVEIEYLIINRFKAENEITFELELFDLSDEPKKEAKRDDFVMTKFCVGDKDLTNEAKKYISYEKIPKKLHVQTYSTRVNFKKTIDKHCKNTKVVLHYNYKIPISDVTQSYRLTTPCKRLSHQFHMEDKYSDVKFRLKANAYTSFYKGETTGSDDCEVKQTVDSKVDIKFGNWVIPGAGYVVLLTKE